MAFESENRLANLFILAIIFFQVPVFFWAKTEGLNIWIPFAIRFSMVFGFGEGKVEILVPKNSFKPGEAIAGTVHLELKTVKHAKQLRIRIEGVEDRSYSSRDSRGHTVWKTEQRKIYSFDQVLDTEKDYPTGSKDYPFSLSAPANASAGPASPSLSIGGLSLNLGSNKRTVRWYLDASLDVAMSMDISKRVQISIV